MALKISWSLFDMIQILKNPFFLQNSEPLGLGDQRLKVQNRIVVEPYRRRPPKRGHEFVELRFRHFNSTISKPRATPTARSATAPLLFSHPGSKAIASAF